MLYGKEVVQSIAEKILKKKVYLIPVGNHELNRHLVYHIIDDHGLSVIFKLFFKKNRWNREVASLKLLSDTEIKCPNLINYGVLDDGTEWVITEYISGEPLNRVLDRISKENFRNILAEMGMELSKIHSFNTFPYFGNWDENGNSLFKFENFKPAFVRSAEIVINQLTNQDLPERELHLKGVKRLREQYDLIDRVNIPRLCHNDFDERNILVKKFHDVWKLVGIIDFEQSFPWDSDKDLVNLYHRFCRNDKENEKEFIKGYNRFLNLNEDFYLKKDFYLLFNALSICSWAYEVAPEHYREGVNILLELLE